MVGYTCHHAIVVNAASVLCSSLWRFRKKSATCTEFFFELGFSTHVCCQLVNAVRSYVAVCWVQMLVFLCDVFLFIRTRLSSFFAIFLYQVGVVNTGGHQTSGVSQFLFVFGEDFGLQKFYGSIIKVCSKNFKICGLFFPVFSCTKCFRNFSLKASETVLGSREFFCQYFSLNHQRMFHHRNYQEIFISDFADCQLFRSDWLAVGVRGIKIFLGRKYAQPTNQQYSAFAITPPIPREDRRLSVLKFRRLFAEYPLICRNYKFVIHHYSTRPTGDRRLSLS